MTRIGSFKLTPTQGRVEFDRADRSVDIHALTPDFARALGVALIEAAAIADTQQKEIRTRYLAARRGQENG